MKNPLRSCHVAPKFARVMFSVADTIGERLLSTPRIRAPVIVTASEFGTTPFNSTTPRSREREGN